MPAFTAPWVVTGTSPATATTGVIGTAKGLGSLDAIKVVATLAGATGGTLNVYVQWTPDDGTTWYDLVAFPQKAANSAVTLHSVELSASTTDVSTIGTGTSPALTAGTAAGGTWGNQLRVLAVAGTSTSAGSTVTVKFYGVKLPR